MLTKAEEMKLFTELVSALPEGYVRDILTEATPAIESEIRNDCATAAPISGLIANRDELAQEIKGLQEQAKAEAAGLKLIREELKRIQKAKEDAIAEIRVLARTAGIL